MDSEHLSNRELVTRLVEAGPDDPAWLEFFSRFQSRIRLTVYRAFQGAAERNPGLDVDRTGEMVNDLTQDVFLRLLDSERRPLARFRGRNENSIYTYLNAIAINLVHDHFKRLRAQKTPPASVSLDEPLRVADGPAEGLVLGDTLPSSSQGPEETAQAAELRRRVAGVLGGPVRLKKRDALVFRLYFVEGRTIDEVASCQAVRLSPSGVEKCIHRLREAVQKELAGGTKEGGLGVKKSSTSTTGTERP